MDRMIYTAMTGAKTLMQRQDVLANNLANVNTNGYRATTSAFRVAPVTGPGLATRAFAVESTTGADFSPGTIQTTGRMLDVAVQSAGWFAVQAQDGTEGYTRNGAFDLSEQGTLQTSSGQPVLGDGGPLTVPAGHRVEIAADGSISAVSPANHKSVISLGRLKLVNPQASGLMRSGDGLFRMRDGSTPDADPRVRVAGGALEGSNVNVVEAMVGMISLARQFDTQMKLLQAAEGNARKATQLLAVNG